MAYRIWSVQFISGLLTCRHDNTYPHPHCLSDCCRQHSKSTPTSVQRWTKWWQWEMVCGSRWSMTPLSACSMLPTSHTCRTLILLHLFAESSVRDHHGFLALVVLSDSSPLPYFCHLLIRATIQNTHTLPPIKYKCTHCYSIIHPMPICIHIYV